MDDSFKEHPVHKDYFASPDGLVWSNFSNQLMNGWKLRSGYHFVSLRGKKMLRHRFVYECFNGVIEPGIQIDHIDSDPSNNVLVNLQALTMCDHAKKTHQGQSRPGDKNSKALTRFKLNADGERIEVSHFNTYAEAAESINQENTGHIRSVVKGRRKTCGGFFWEYTEQSDLEGEAWCCPRDPRWKGIEVSTLGRIKSIHGIKSFGQIKSDGYRSTSVRRKMYRTHHIICTVFHGSPPDDDHNTVDHIDNDRLNNHPSNLRWATRQMQADNTHSKAVVAYDEHGKEVGRWISATAAAQEIGRASTNITSCLRGRKKTCKDLIWKYA